MARPEDVRNWLFRHVEPAHYAGTLHLNQSGSAAVTVAFEPCLLAY